jgi:alcohol dehydrogenase class IV
MPDEVRWRDAERGRSVLLRNGLLGEVAAALADEGWADFELLTTERALADAPQLAEAAAATHLVPRGQVPDTAAALLDEVGSDRIVAFGGGRVIDSAKAIAAVKGAQVAAIPTTMSGAEMTAIHRLPAGHQNLAGVRPSLVLADPEAITSAPEPELRASSMNALGHGADSLYTPIADDLSRASALKGAKLIADSLDAGRDDRDASDLALGSLLSANALDLAGLALHHVLSQTVVRVLGTPHAQTNAALLPVTMEAMRTRAPERIAALAQAIGAEPHGIRVRIEELGGGRRGLGELGADRSRLGEAIEASMARPELFRMTPGELDRADLERILEAAW